MYEPLPPPILRLSINSKMHREAGNKLFSGGDSFKALELYNKGLIVAEAGSQDIALTYANRSAVYMAAKEYQLCLDNIDLARNAGYPIEKISVLDDREKRCRDAMASEDPDPNSDPWTFFKLSYPANEKIPFIVHCLELRQNLRFGRHIVTNRDLNPGDIIAIEEPFVVEPNISAWHLRCGVCLKSNKMSLIVNDLFPQTMFCSKECIDKVSKIIPHELQHLEGILTAKYLFETLDTLGGSFEKLQQLSDDPELSNMTVFDFDLSDKSSPLYKYQMLLAFNSLCRTPLSYHQKCWVQEKAIDQLTFLKSREETDIAINFLYRFNEIVANAVLIMDWRVPVIPGKNKAGPQDKLNIGTGVFPFAGLMNISCIPNIDRVVVDNKFVFFVRRPIKKSDQLFITFGMSYLGVPRDIRQHHLQTVMGFRCTCEACVGNYKMSMEHAMNHQITRLKSSKIEYWKKEFQKNCKIIAKNTRRGCPSYSVAELMFKNRFLLTAISKVEPSIFNV